LGNNKNNKKRRKDYVIDVFIEHIFEILLSNFNIVFEGKKRYVEISIRYFIYGK